MATKTKATQATPTPPATTPNKGLMQPHQMLLSPSVQGAVGIHAWSKFMGEADLLSLVEDLRAQVRDVQRGELGRVEAMLFSQAVTLETIFTSLARRAAANDGLKQFQVNLTLALKAQAQSRATLEALAEIKNPRPVAFVKQANINNGGQQQVNNEVARPGLEAPNPAAAAVAVGPGDFGQSLVRPLVEGCRGRRPDLDRGVTSTNTIPCT